MSFALKCMLTCSFIALISLLWVFISPNKKPKWVIDYISGVLFWVGVLGWVASIIVLIWT
jgi:hypothetical protein